MRNFDVRFVFPIFIEFGTHWNLHSQQKAKKIGKGTRQWYIIKVYIFKEHKSVIFSFKFQFFSVNLAGLDEYVYGCGESLPLLRKNSRVRNWLMCVIYALTSIFFFFSLLKETLLNKVTNIDNTILNRSDIAVTKIFLFGNFKRNNVIIY